MSLLTALQKLFSKRDRFAPPKKFRLNSKELESVLVFFAILFMVLIITVFAVFHYF